MKKLKFDETYSRATPTGDHLQRWTGQFQPIHSAGFIDLAGPRQPTLGKPRHRFVNDRRHSLAIKEAASSGLTIYFHGHTIPLSQLNSEQGASTPGWGGLKAKPVQVRCCPATVSSGLQIHTS
jgi:hypothetical protein